MLHVTGHHGFQAGAGGRPGSAMGRALRFFAAVVLAVPVVAKVAGDSSVSATDSLVPRTAFEIDGNLVVNGNSGVPNVSIAGDWGVSAGTPASSWTDGTYGPGATPAPGSFASTGSYYMYRNMDFCDSDQDTIGVGGDKVEDGPNWPVNIGNVLNKGDVKSVSLAAEKVNVNGQINDIVYAAFELCQDAGGSFNASMYFDDGDGVPPSAGDNGDYLILFDFKSAQVGEGSLFKRIGGTWVFQNKDATKIDTFASGLVGEAAVNLTTLGILPGVTDPVNNPTACRTIQVGGQAATISGYSTGSQLKDIVDVTPLDLSNCGPLKVKKVSNATDTTTEFGYDVFQADSQQMHDSTLGVSGGAITAPTEPDANVLEIDATINVGETHTWTNVISQPDYKITEDTPPVGWSLVSISCTYPNIFAALVGGVYPLATVQMYPVVQTDPVSPPPFPAFLVPPSFIDLGGASPVTLPAAECTITNNVTGIKIVKTGAGDPSTKFDFVDDSVPAKVAELTIADDPATTGVIENAATFTYVGDTDVTITETIPETTPAWTLVGVSCTLPDGTVVATSATPSVSVATVAGEVITCTYTNNQRSRLTLVKSVTNNNGGTAVATDFTLSAAGPTPISGAGGVSSDVDAGTYALSETSVPGYGPGAWSCDGGTQTGASVALTLGQSATCTIVNDDQSANLTLVKTVINDNGGTAASTDFTLSAAGPTPISGAGGVVSGVNAGTYTLTETSLAGYAAGSWHCSKNAGDAVIGSSISLALGDSATCSIINDDIAPILQLRKLVTNDNGGNATVADFTLTANGAGTNDLSGISPVDSGAGLLADTWALSENTVAGYSASDWSCVGGVQSGANITVGIGGEATCTITNDDKPIDLEIIKSDGGANPILGGAFNYTLTITNLGTRDPDAGEPIVVTDLLPAGLLYSTPLPAGCVAAGQTLTCTLAAADLGPGESVVLTIPVTVSLSATAGTVTNKAWVTTDDDPVCVECTPPPPCPAAFSAGALVSNSSNNVDCEDTPIQEVADLAIVKTVSDATPTLGQSFDWILTVTNNGPNVAKDVEISDLVPASVVVTGVASADFACLQVGNGVSCTRATMAVGATGTIRITVLLPVTTPVETTIVNVAEVTGSVFDPDLTNNTSRATAIPEPPVVLPPTTPPFQIPETGSDAASGLLLGLAMVLFGVLASIIARRRSRHRETNA